MNVEQKKENQLKSKKQPALFAQLKMLLVPVKPMEPVLLSAKMDF